MFNEKKILSRDIEHVEMFHLSSGVEKMTLSSRKSIFPVELSQTSPMKKANQDAYYENTLDDELRKWLKNESKEADLHFLVEEIKKG